MALYSFLGVEREIRCEVRDVGARGSLEVSGLLVFDGKPLGTNVGVWGFFGVCGAGANVGVFC